MRVVLDTNVWVSALIEPAGPSAGIVSAVAAGRLTLVLSGSLLDELANVLRRPRLARFHGRDAREIDGLLSDLRARSSWVVPDAGLRLCRDAKDDHVIATALARQVQVLVTGDADFSGSPEVTSATDAAGIRILTPRELAGEL